MLCGASPWRSSIWSTAISCSRDGPSRAFDTLVTRRGEKTACRTLVELLSLAHERACEAELAEIIDRDLEAGRLPDLESLSERFRATATVLPHVVITLLPLCAYDELGTVRPGGAA
jgi:hypothetical protein